MATIEKIVCTVIENYIPEDKRRLLSLDSDFRKDLGLDSLKLIGLIFELRDKANFDITLVDNNELKKITTVRDIVHTIEKQIKT